MTLPWIPEAKKIAKEEGKALIKFQAQLKQCGGGNFMISGPTSKEHAMGLFLMAALPEDDPKVVRILDILEAQEVP